MTVKSFKALFLGLILLLSLYPSLVSANVQIVPKLKLCTFDTCFDNTSPIYLKPNQSVMLQLSLINDQNKWICFDSINYQFVVSSDNLNNKVYIQKSALSQNSQDLPSFCLKPDRNIETSFYLPFGDYNGATRQIGNWMIDKFHLSFSNMKCYNSFDLKNSDCGYLDPTSDFIANPIEFNVRQDEPSKGWNPRPMLKSILTVLAIICGLFVATCIGGIAKSKKKRIWILLLIVTLVIMVFLAYYGILEP